MRLSIDHHTIYRFSEPQTRLVQLLRMTPSDNAHQTVIDWRIDVDCDARLRAGRDGYGNATAMLYVDGPIDAIELTVRGEVLTDAHDGLVAGTAEPLPPLIFTRTTALTTPDAGITALAEKAGSDALTLGRLVHEAVEWQPGRTPKSRTAAEVLDQRKGSGRDLAHVLVAAARAAGWPARLVSGHCLGGPARGHRKSAHCWVELYRDGRWTAYDPAAGCCPDESYVRVAVGLDASDSTPLSGTRRGGGIEELDVEVNVQVSQGQA